MGLSDFEHETCKNHEKNITKQNCPNCDPSHVSCTHIAIGHGQSKFQMTIVPKQWGSTRENIPSSYLRKPLHMAEKEQHLKCRQLHGRLKQGALGGTYIVNIWKHMH